MAQLLTEEVLEKLAKKIASLANSNLSASSALP
jgi:hypothetical protein